MKAIIIRGDRGSGKTKACMKILEEARQRGFRAGGVICPSILAPDGTKTGCLALDAATGMTVELGSNRKAFPGPGWKRWSFSDEGFAFANAAVGSALLRADRIVFLDEIGPIELETSRGLIPSLRLLEAAIRNSWFETAVAVVPVRPELVESVGKRLGSSPVLDAARADLDAIIADAGVALLDVLDPMRAMR
ncbi:MAG: hypothetical protein NT080_02885 [Spirochaetes bacterium]|nr:hypothetical protein [Spirochaetota bacterium]